MKRLRPYRCWCGSRFRLAKPAETHLQAKHDGHGVIVYSAARNLPKISRAESARLLLKHGSIVNQHLKRLTNKQKVLLKYPKAMARFWKHSRTWEIIVMTKRPPLHWMIKGRGQTETSAWASAARNLPKRKAMKRKPTLQQEVEAPVLRAIKRDHYEWTSTRGDALWTPAGG